MNMNRIIGVTLLIVGAILLGIGYQSTGAPLEQLSETVTGRYSDPTMWYLGVGIAAAAVGGLLLVFGGRSSSRRGSRSSFGK